MVFQVNQTSGKSTQGAVLPASQKRENLAGNKDPRFQALVDTAKAKAEAKFKRAKNNFDDIKDPRFHALVDTAIEKAKTEIKQEKK
jgi:hypothetical protein